MPNVHCNLYYENQIEFTEEISTQILEKCIKFVNINETLQIHLDHRKCGADQMTTVDIPLHSSTQ